MTCTSEQFKNIEKECKKTWGDEMNISIKKKIENDLREYPFLLIAVDAGGLGYPTNHEIVKDVKHPSTMKGSFVESCVIDEEYNKKKVDKITRALELLDITEKEIVEECYFRNTYTNQQIISNMCISKAKFYKVKNDSLRKIAISLGYL